MSNILIPARSGIEGYFHLEIRRGGCLVRELPRFRNLITNTGVQHWQTNKVPRFYFQLGTSNAAVAPTDTALQAPVGGKIQNTGSTSRYVNKTVMPFYAEFTYKAVFAMNTVAGNLAEVGTYYQNPNNSGSDITSLFSRSLLKDTSGNPTVITVLPMEEVTLYYTLRVYDDLQDTSGSFTLGSETYNYTSYACTSPEYLGRSTDARGGASMVTNGSSQFWPTLGFEKDTPAQVRKNSFNLGLSKTMTLVGNNAANDGVIFSATLDYASSSNNLPGNASIAGLFLFHNACNPRRYVLAPPIPKDPTRKLTFMMEFTGDRYTP